MISRVVDRNWESEFKEALQLDTTELLIVSPFIKARALTKLLADPPASARVITRFNLEDFAQGVSDIRALRLLLDSGAAVRGIRNLHAKLYVFGSARAMITSANLTVAGMVRNHEFGVVTDEKRTVSICRDYFDRLWKKADANLTVDMVAAWENTINHRQTCGGRIAASDDLPDDGVDIGISCKREDQDASVFDNREQAFVKFLGQGHDRAALSRKVLEEVEGSGCHWALAYPKNKRPRNVRDEAVMFISRMVEGGDTRVFGRGIGLAHKPGRDDATQADIERREWKSIWPRYIRVHDVEFVNGTLANGVSLGKLMDSLGSRCFAPTSRNAAAGRGNTNPRLALRNHAAVELSDGGAAWLEQELEAKLDAHGRIPKRSLKRLDWPVVPGGA